MIVYAKFQAMMQITIMGQTKYHILFMYLLVFHKISWKLIQMDISWFFHEWNKN